MFYLDHWRKHLTYLLQFFCKKENRTGFFFFATWKSTSLQRPIDVTHFILPTVLYWPLVLKSPQLHSITLENDDLNIAGF